MLDENYPNTSDQIDPNEERPNIQLLLKRISDNFTLEEQMRGRLQNLHNQKQKSESRCRQLNKLKQQILIH